MSLRNGGAILDQFDQKRPQRAFPGSGIVVFLGINAKLAAERLEAVICYCGLDPNAFAVYAVRDTLV